MSASFTRREAVASLLALSGTFVVGSRAAFAARQPSGASGRIRFPQGLASGDPTPSSVILWTRAEPVTGTGPVALTAQISRNREFDEVVAEYEAVVGTDSDHVFRLIVEDLDPATTYYYRFFSEGDVSPLIGRTRTAPDADADVPVRFGLVSCQHLQLGTMALYRQMIAEDEDRPAGQRLDFILHLGDFIYEEIWYPEERETFLRRPVRDTVRLPDGGGDPDLRWPVSLDDYRTIYKAYLSDPDLMAARARWPFICVWDDHEFSNNSWQSHQAYDNPGQPAQQRKVAANQAWFEYIPAYLTGNAGVAGVSQSARDFEPVSVENIALDDFDDNFQSREPNNLAALNSLRINRSLRWGRNVELILTDNRSFRSPPPFDGIPSDRFGSRDAPWYSPEDIIAILDGGRGWNGGEASARIAFDGEEVDNLRRDLPSGTVLGPDQKRWFKQTVARSDAVWKLWGNSIGMLTRRIDLHNLPADRRASWRGDSYAVYGTDDWVGYPAERAELLDHIADSGVANFVSLTGDRHNFFAGRLSASLPPDGFGPVAVEFTTSSLTTPTSFEAAEYVFSRREDPPLEFFAVRRHSDGSVEPMLNMSVMHGIRSSLAYAGGASLDEALALSNPDIAPHLAFADMASHGFTTVRVDGDGLEVEFASFRRPLDERIPDPLYRTQFRVPAWQAGDEPQLDLEEITGEPPIPFGTARLSY